MKSTWLLLGFSLICINTSALHAEIHRWQDEDGNWQFSDKPVEGKSEPINPGKRTQDNADKAASSSNAGSAQTPTAADSAEKNAPVGGTLQDKLQEKFRADSAISRVTLSVVAIETHMGSGSGFFISSMSSSS